MSRRGINEERAHKLSLLEKISQHRKKQNDPEISHRRRVIIGLSDSDDDVGSDEEEIYLTRASESGDEEPTVVQPPRSAQNLKDPLSHRAFEGPNEILNSFKKLEIKGSNVKTSTEQDFRKVVVASDAAAQAGPGARSDQAQEKANLQKEKGDKDNKKESKNVPCLRPELDDRLFEHQKQGLSWLWGLYQIPSGGMQHLFMEWY